MAINIKGMTSDKSWDYENGFYWFSHPSRINKLIAHYEIYKKIVDIPGDIFELGVYKGTSLIRFATFRNNLENDYSRRIVGFDVFGEFPVDGLSIKEDKQFVEQFVEAGGSGLADSELASIIHEKGFRNVHLIKGNVLDSIPKYKKENPHTRISLLHLDMDVKEPTIFALRELYDMIVPMGIIVVDDYNAVVGATEAVDEFVQEKKLIINKTSNYNVPSFIVKVI